MNTTLGTDRRSVVATLGIVGGGQLAKMTAQAATALGCDVVVLERGTEFPAQSLDTQSIVGDWNDARELLALSKLCDVMTLENEFVDADALAEVERAGHPLFPSSRTIRTVQDKFVQKTEFARAGLPLPRFRSVATPRDVVDAATEWGWPLVLKKRRNGYDGKGNATVRAAADVPRAWESLGGETNALYVEQFCPFVAELAIMITRGRDGSYVAYPVVETIQKDHICHVVRVPSPAIGPHAARVEEIARRAVEAVDGVGSFGLELFLLDDGALLVNEIAPRVHNSGHYTIEACETSQFENHVRAVLGWPLGSTALRAPAAAMVNLLGAGRGSGTPVGIDDALRVPGAHVHVYGKRTSERGRKMGHVTALGRTSDEALATARAAADRIRFGTPS